MKVYFHFTGENEERCIKFQSFEEEEKKTSGNVIVWVNYDLVLTCL